MSEVKYAIAILKEKLANADRHNLAYQRLSIADMEAIWGTLEKSDKDCTTLKAERDALAAEGAARGEIIERLIGQYSAAGYHAVQNSLNPAQSLLYDAMQVLKQPATDAYFNSVRADTLTRIINTGEFSNWVNQGLQVWVNRFNANSDAQLRAGKDGE